MNAIDTSSLRRFLAGEKGRDADLVALSIAEARAVVPPAVICEALSDPALPADLADAIAGLPALEILEGYWVRAGLLRARLIRRGRKAKLADVLIAQACIDHEVPLITNDRDFRHFVAHGLKVV